MKTIHNPSEEKQSVELAVGTFIISTILFMLYIISNESPNILVIAWPFALAAIVVNLIMFFSFSRKLYSFTSTTKRHWF